LTEDSYFYSNIKNCILIIDQFKYENDKNLDEIIHLIKNSSNKNKIIVSSSINDSGVKSKLVNDLSKHCENIYPLMMNINDKNKFIKKEGIKEKKNDLENKNLIKKDEIEDDEEKEKSEKDDEIEFKTENEINNTLSIDEQNYYNEYYKNFLKISIFNFKSIGTIQKKTKEKKNKSQGIINKINDHINVKNDFYNDLLKNQENYISHAKYEIIEKKTEQLLYISELINVQELVKNVPKEFKKCMEYFNYLPKYYNKFIRIFRKLKISHKNIDYNKIIQIFYDEMKKKIIKKIHQSYKN
jgi:vacuolar-type H+-ATPase subunit H